MTLIKTEPTVQKKKASVPIDQIKIDLYARVKLNDDRVMHFAILYENDPESVEPIEIAPDFSLTAGRHRIAGAELAGLKNINCNIVVVESKAHQMERALLENINPNAPLPPTKADIVFSIKELIRLGQPLLKVTATICKFYPEKIAKAYVQEARMGIARDKMSKAMRDVTDNNLSVAAAAEKNDIKPELLREAITGKKKGKGKNTAAEFKKNLSTQFRSQGQKISKILEKAINAYENNDMNKEDTLAVFDYFDRYVKGQLTRIKEQRMRFTNMS